MMTWGSGGNNSSHMNIDDSMNKAPADAISVRQTSTSHLQLKVMRALAVDACTFRQVRTWVYVKVFYKNTLYTTETVKDMGKNPIWATISEEANWFPFDFTDQDDIVTLELFNRNNDSIGIAKLKFRDVSGMSPESTPEERILPVMVPVLGWKKEKQSGQLVVLTQMKRSEASGEHGDLILTLRKGYLKGATSWKSKVSDIQAYLTYRHVTFKSGKLQKTGDKFVWLEGSGGTFNFLINKTDSNDKIKIQVFNHRLLAGECDIWLESLKKVEAITLPLLLKDKPVGSIEVTTFLKSVTVDLNASDFLKEALNKREELVIKLERHKKLFEKSPHIANFLALRTQRTLQVAGWGESIEQVHSTRSRKLTLEQ